MTTINEVSQVDISKLKTIYGDSQGITSALSTNYRQSDDFQKQIEKTVTRRFELFCNLYLEQIKFWERFVESSNNFQQNGLAKLGLKVDKPEFQDMTDAWNNGLRSWYANQTSYSEMVLSMLHQNMRMTTMNMDGLSKTIWSNFSWWIPPD